MAARSTCTVRVTPAGTRWSRLRSAGNPDNASAVSPDTISSTSFPSARIVITGGPGAGKTTLLLALQARGYTIVGDTARTIIQDRRSRGLSPRPDPHAFGQEMLRMDIENFAHHAASPGPVFFERGVLDALCWLDHVAP